MTDERAAIERLAQSARDDPGGVPIDEIASGLESQDDPVREQAATALHAVSVERPRRVTDAVPRLAALLESDRTLLRSKALATMANVADQRPEALVPHVDTIVESLYDESSTVHRPTTRSLRAVAAVEPSAVTSAVPRLGALLDSNVESTRSHAAGVLKYVADEDPDAVYPVVEQLLDLVEDSYDRQTDITYDPTLSSTDAGPAEQMRGFRALTEDPEGRSSNAAARETAVETIAALADEDPAKAADALDAHLRRLFDRLDDHDRTVRATVAEIITSVAETEPAAVRPFEDELIDVLDDPTRVSKNAVRALQSVGSERALRALRDLASDETTSVALRLTAERALEDDLE